MESQRQDVVIRGEEPASDQVIGAAEEDLEVGWDTQAVKRIQSLLLELKNHF